jgi:hypothetical protein
MRRGGAKQVFRKEGEVLPLLLPRRKARKKDRGKQK